MLCNHNKSNLSRKEQTGAKKRRNKRRGHAVWLCPLTGHVFNEQVPKAVTTRGLTKEHGNTKTTEAPSSARPPSKTFSSLPPPHFFSISMYTPSIRSKCPLPSIFTFRYLCHPCAFAYCVPSFLNIPFKIHLCQFWTTILTRWASPYVGHLSPIYSCRVKRMIQYCSNTAWLLRLFPPFSPSVLQSTTAYRCKWGPYLTG